MPDGIVPCSASEVTIELAGEAASRLDPELVRHATAGVLQYFRKELGREYVTVAEFCQALAKVLQAFGFDVDLPEQESSRPDVVDSDLRLLACESGKGFELAFFPKLREELDRQLTQSPRVIRFTGLRSCVKQLEGAQRWSGRCQRLSDQIVEYLRACMSRAEGARDCALLVV